MSIRSKIQALIAAANNTTGESDTTLTDAIQTLVDGYGQGGGVTTQPLSVTENGTYTAPSGTAYTPVTVNVPSGGSLPSVISKIDGGSFTLASDTLTGNHSITHSLGVVPSGIAMWSDDIVVEAYSVRTVKYLVAIGTAYVIMQINTNAADRQVNGTLASGNLSASSFKITLASNYYKAGATYKWLAWA